MGKQRGWTGSAVEQVRIDDIEIGERRRLKPAKVAALARAIERVGLLNPITIREDGTLVAGLCRIEAAKRLGWKTIPARRFERMSDEELREAELLENTARTDFTDYEKSKQRLREIEAAEQGAAEVSSQPGTKVSGRPAQSDSVREVAKKTGLSKNEVDRTRKHVAAAESVPAFQNRDWTRGQVLDAAAKLETLPDSTRSVAVDMISEPGIPSKVGVQIIETLAAKPPAERKEIETLYRSDDEEQRELAKTRAALRPPPAPHRLQWLRDAIRLVDKVIDDASDVAAEDLKSAAAGLRSALKASEDDYKRRRRAEGF